MNRDDQSAECSELEEHAHSVKKRFLAMYRKANAGHIGSSLSCTELLVFLRFAWMNPEDTFILSKGHAVGALYSLLRETGRLSEAQIESFYEEGTQLPALPPFNAIDDIPFATGSLGYGLSLSAGMALGANLAGRSRRFFCVTSDGELDEGSVWEAALFIAHHKLTNVVWLIDRNRIQAIGRTEQVMALEPLDAKLRAFGFHVATVDGHDFRALLAARDECTRIVGTRRAPVVIIAETNKGHGVSSMQDTVDCHYLPLNETEYHRALRELSLLHEARMNGYLDAR
jgi:transketolase